MLAIVGAGLVGLVCGWYLCKSKYKSAIEAEVKKLEDEGKSLVNKL